MLVPKVLVVDDEEPFRSIYCRFLSAHGYRTFSASSAVEATDLIATTAPHLALVDIVMPEIDGIELLKKLRRNPSTALLPVILFTGLSVPDSLLHSAAVGLDAGPIVVKGGDLYELLKQIDQTLHERRVGVESHLGASTRKRGTATLDIDLRRVRVNGLEVALPPRRFDLLRALFESEIPVSRQDLLHRIWPESENPSIVDVNVLRLRLDLRRCPALRIETTPLGLLLVIVNRSI